MNITKNHVLVAAIFLAGSLNAHAGIFDSITDTIKSVGDIVTNSVGSSVPSSKYQPRFSSVESVDKYIEEVVKPVNNQVVTDEQGVYYHQLNDGAYLLTTYFNKMEDSLLRVNFTDSVGILAPTYKWAGEKLVVDWPATERRYKLFTAKNGMKLLPYEATKKYSQALDAASMKNGGDPDGYSHRVAAEVLSGLNLSADYIIKSGDEELYFNNLPQFSRNVSFANDQSFLETGIQSMVVGSQVYFEPLAMAEQARSGFAHMASRCGFIDLDKYKGIIKWQSDRSLLGIKVTKVETKSSDLNDLRAAAKKAEGSELKDVQKRYSQAMANQLATQKQTEAGCEIGLNKLKVTGSFSSSQLK